MAAKASGVLTLDTAPFIKSLEAAKVALKGFAVAVAAIALTAVAGFAVLGVGIFKIVSIFKEGVIAAFAFGKEMNAAARQIQGVSVGNLFLIQKALEKSGMSADEARASMKSMEESGRNWSDLWVTPVAAAKAIAASKKDFGPLADALTKGALAIDQIKNSIDSLRLKFASFFQAFLAEVVKPLSYLIDKAKDMLDVSGFGKSLGAVMGNVLDEWIGGIANKNLGTVLGVQLKLAFLGIKEKITDLFTEASEGMTFFKDSKAVFVAIGSLLVTLLIGAFKEGAYLMRDVLSQSFKILGDMLGINRVAANAAQEVKIQDESIRILKREKEFDLLNVKAGGTSRQAEFDEKIKEGFVQRDRLQAISNYESGKAGINTPLQDSYVQEYLTSKGENTEFKDTLRRAETAKEIAAKTAILEAAGLKAGGTIGAVATQIVGFGNAFNLDRSELETEQEMARLAGQEARAGNDGDAMSRTAPPLLAGKPFEALTTSLGKIGGGGGSFLTGQTAQEQREAQKIKNGQETNKLLNKIDINTNPENPKAGAKGPVMLP
jgi:hypothetical protein